MYFLTHGTLSKYVVQVMVLLSISLAFSLSATDFSITVCSGHYVSAAEGCW
jgi:hypothetical protein